MTFNDPVKEAFRKNCRKRRKHWLQAFSPFPTMLSTLLNKHFDFQVTFFFFLSSSNAFNLIQSRISLFGKELSRSWLHFAQMFSKAFIIKVIETQKCVVKAYPNKRIFFLFWCITKFADIDNRVHERTFLTFHKTIGCQHH